MVTRIIVAIFLSLSVRTKAENNLLKLISQIYPKTSAEKCVVQILINNTTFHGHKLNLFADRGFDEVFTSNKVQLRTSFNIMGDSRIFASIRHQEICMVVVMLCKLNKQRGGIVGDFDLSDIMFQTSTHVLSPKFMIALLFEKTVFKGNLKYYTVLPPGMENSKLFVFMLKSESTETVNSPYLIGCYTSEKSGSIDFETLDPQKYFVTVTLENPASLLPQTKINSAGFSQGVTFQDEANECSLALLQGTASLSIWNDGVAGCLKQIFFQWQNITSKKLYFHLAKVLLPDYQTQPDFASKGAFPLSFGVEIDGLRFSVVLGKHEQNEMNPLTILGSPFETSTWILFLCSIGGVFILLSITRKVESGKLLYWTISVIFEQGDSMLPGIRAGNNCLVIFSWLWGLCILRHFYTSEMCSKMTAIPEPQNIPTSFEMLLKENKKPIHIIAVKTITTQLFKLVNSTTWSKMTGNNKTTEKVAIEESLLNKMMIIRLGGKYNGKTFSQFFDGSFVRCESYWNRINLLNDKNPKSCCLSNRFVWIEDLVGRRSLYSPKYTKVLLGVFGKRVIKENIDPPIFVRHRMWAIRRKYFFFDQFNRLLSWFAESGISEKFSEGLDIAKLNRSISGANQNGLVKNVYSFSKNIVNKKFESKIVDRYNHATIDNIFGVMKVSGCLHFACLVIFLTEVFMGYAKEILCHVYWCGLGLK